MLKNKFMKNIISIIIAIVFTSVVFLPYGTVHGLSPKTQDTLEIALTQGKAALIANGVSIPCQKPYRNANTFYIPMKTVLEVIGADIETAVDGTITVTYRDATAKIKVGSADFTFNQEKKNLPAPPVLSGNVVMIPLEFMKLGFDVSTTYDNKTGKATILLTDDGSLSDLSFLTGSITTIKAGNSYFGWNVSLPKGTRVASQSFNSKYVQFENDHFGFDLEISAGYNEGKTLKQYYDQIQDDPYSLLDVEPLETSLNLDAKPQYIELLYNDSYDEAVSERIYIKGSNYIDLTVTSFDEVDPFKLRNDKTIKAMIDSFGLSYKGNLADTADLSSVTNGLAKYSNYIASESTGKKYLSWEMNILPEWDLKDQSASNSFSTEFDGNPGEYIRVELDIAGDQADIEAKGKSISEDYLKNFNPSYFTLKSSGLTQIAGYKCYELRFEVKYGTKIYNYVEKLILDNGVIFDITFKSPEAAYTKNLQNFNKMISSFKTSVKDNDKILDELQKNVFSKTKNNVGKDDTLAIYENKAFKWKITLPGYWQKSSTSGQSLENFYDGDAGALVAVEASVLKAGEAAKSDSERFLSMKFSDKMPEKPVRTATEQYKGRSITTYQYRIDDAESETFADIYYYIFEGGGFKYCFMTTIPDLTSSEFNLGSLKSIWDSFEITK